MKSDGCSTVKETSASFDPSEDNIKDVMQKLENAKRTSGKPFAIFHDLYDGRCVKHAPVPFMSIEEARVMEYVRLHTNIPVPKVIMAFERDDTVFIVMEYIKAATLEFARAKLTNEQLRNVALQLMDFIAQIRSLTLPPNQGLGFWKGGAYRNVFFRPTPWETADVVPRSAFKSIGDFHAYWVTRSGLDKPLDNPDSYAAILSHGDLGCRNILMEPTGAKILAVIDWDTFGWYPDFWETMIIHRDALWSQRWESALSDIIPRRPVDEMYHDILDAAFQERDEW
ncbi:kinase-like domain-containing protein [Collybia nuda]|uniref:Kinase-like domain-containing protein n=1 Tax=Collybia nuda TaxID=64659 RepID=A0A9P6CA82_9AGAR|nr:kinase-like domain-containing protein [Collybia nuda]